MAKSHAKEKLSVSNDIHELWKGKSLPLLQALHILTRDQKLNADSRRKLKQVHHLAQFIEPLLKKIHTTHPDFTVVDMGAGKSYLGFILYDLILRPLQAGRMISIESRPELVARAQALAVESGFDRMEFLASPIATASVPGDVDLVCALHACDTATDDAILFGLRQKAKSFALVPCCQAEIARELEIAQKKMTDETAKSLFSHSLHRREFGSHLTNVIRTLFLQAHGYQVTVTELIGWEHSLKNELILAERVSDEEHPQSKKARKALKDLLTLYPIQMRLFVPLNAS